MCVWGGGGVQFCESGQGGMSAPLLTAGALKRSGVDPLSCSSRACLHTASSAHTLSSARVRFCSPVRTSLASLDRAGALP